MHFLYTIYTKITPFVSVHAIEDIFIKYTGNLLNLVKYEALQRADLCNKSYVDIISKTMGLVYLEQVCMSLNVDF